MFRALPLLALTFFLTGCGTNVMWLLSEESRIMAEADALVVSAEQAGSGLEVPVYEAEDAKNIACDFLHAAVFDRLQRDPGFFEQFVSDLSSAIVLMLPVSRVEECADAFAAYSAAVDTLAASISDAAELPGSDQTAGDAGSIN
jgi:hypothetical protein